MNSAGSSGCCSDACVADLGAWEAEGGGAFPAFTGSLSAADEGAGFCRLDLDGAYSPPLGPAGALFDAVLGKRIAQATVGDPSPSVGSSSRIAALRA